MKKKNKDLQEAADQTKRFLRAVYKLLKAEDAYVSLRKVQRSPSSQTTLRFLNLHIWRLNSCKMLDESPESLLPSSVLYSIAETNVTHESEIENLLGNNCNDFLKPQLSKLSSIVTDGIHYDTFDILCHNCSMTKHMGWACWKPRDIEALKDTEICIRRLKKIRKKIVR